MIDELKDRFKHRRDPYRCEEAVELVTDYLEGAMSPSDVARFEKHLALCDDCVTYVGLVRATVDTLGRVHPPAPDAATSAALLDAFRHATSPPSD